MIKFIIILFFSSICFAEDDFFIRYSVNAGGKLSNLRGLSIGIHQDIGLISFKHEAGVLLDKLGSNMVYGQTGIGVEPSSKHFYVHYFQSIGAVTSEDQYLSGYFQFFSDVGIGFIGNNKVSVGVGLKHVSNGGIVKPNIGKDTINLLIRIPID